MPTKKKPAAKAAPRKKAAPKFTAKEFSNFALRTYRDCQTIFTNDYNILYILRRFTSEKRGGRRLIDDRSEFNLAELLVASTPLLVLFLQDDGGDDLANFLQKKWDEMNPGFRDKVISAGETRFDSIPVLFPVGTEVVVCAADPAQSHGAEVVGHSMFGNAIEVEVRFIAGMKGRPVWAQKKVRIFPFDHAAKLEDLPLALVDEATKAKLTERGRVFARFNAHAEAHYATYKGSLVITHFWGQESYRAEGRCMVDPVGFTRFDQSQFENTQSSYTNRWWDEDNERDKQQVPCVLGESNLWQSSPTIPGYSLVAKRWGMFLVENLTEIEFRDRAISQLVLEEDKKQLILALVKHNDNRVFTDIVDNKGAGTIFLLHGPPGTGKTLTAEAIAEALRRPLYHVTVGELGTDPERLEDKLVEVLELAAMWKAVLLIDEADIFLERRGHDIVRNSMVGVFLRLLERHNGVLVLTTNRVSEFDEAFHSRINLAIRYSPMDAAKRQRVWQNLLEAAGITHLDPAELAQLDGVDGRVIRNLIHLASVQATESAEQLSVKHVKQCLAMHREFLAEAGSTPE